MKQDSRNSISVIQRNLDESLKVNPIEDGNTPVSNPHQGYMYTSEINDANYTDKLKSYGFLVESIYSNKSVTGNNSYYQITVTYEVGNEGTHSGWFGANLIKVGDSFVLKNESTYEFNWVKGSVIAISNVSVNSANSPLISYTYTLACAFSEGLTNKLPQGVLNPGDVTFYTDRRIFTETDDKAPINLLSSIRDGKVQFSWDDPTSKSVKYKLTYRLEDNSVPASFYNVCGNHYNFNGKLKAKIDSVGSISTVKIIDPGSSISWETTTPNIITSTLGVTPPALSFYNNGCGELEIIKFKIIEANSWGPNYITCTLAPIGPDLLNLISPRNYVDLYENTRLGEARISNVVSTAGIYTVAIIEYESSFIYTTFDELQADIIGKHIKVHIGVQVFNPGLDMNKEPIISCDKYNENTKYVLEVSSFPSPGTYYWKVDSIFDCNEKSFTEWSQEAKLIII